MFNFFKKINYKFKPILKKEGGFNQLNNFFKEKINAKRYSTGFTMIEIIITIAVLSVGIIGTYNAFYSIMNVADTMSYRLTAAYLAQEGIDIVKNIRDGSCVAGVAFNSGLTSCAGGCQADYKAGTAVEQRPNQLQPYIGSFLKINSDGFYGYDLGTETKFKRAITINQVSLDELQVDSEVFWNYNGKDYSVKSSGYLYNWH